MIKTFLKIIKKIVDLYLMFGLTLKLNRFNLLGVLFLLLSCEKFDFITIPPGPETPAIKRIKFDKFITNSSSTSCGITLARKLFCTLSQNNQGLSFFEYGVPAKWPVKLVDSGRHHLCAIFEGPSFDEIWCKGTGTSGQLGNGASVSSDDLVKVSGLPEIRFIDLGLGGTRSCAVTWDHRVYCWGTGGMIAGVSANSAYETTLTNVLELKGNFNSTCALKNDRSLWCWGTGANGILGQGTTVTISTPVQVKDSLGTGFLENVSDFSVGHTQACAIIDEEVYCWGLSRRVGVDADGSTNLPRHISELSGAVRIESGDYHSCTLSNTGEVYCWGDNRNFQIGGVEVREVIIPRKIALGAVVVKDLSLGNGANPSYARSCVLATDGRFYCWGTSGLGSFGSILPILSQSFALQPEANITSLSIAGSSVCLIKNNQPYSSGYNDYAQFDNDRYIISSPVPISTDTVSDYSCSRYSTCFVSSSELYCKGLSYTGIQKITALGNNVVRAIAGSHTTCALTSDDELKCWGTNSSGQVGNGTTTTSVAATSPYLTMTNVLAAEGSSSFFCALKHDKTVWCWGSNQHGSIGHDNASELIVNNPTMVQGLPDLTSVTNLQLKTEEGAACLLADNDVYCWGRDIGRILSHAEVNAAKAYRINALSGNVKKIGIISAGVCAAYTNSTVSCVAYGSSALSLFPNGVVTKKNYPALPGEIQEIEGGTYLLCTLLTNGRRYCVGNNSAGGMSHAGIQSVLVLNPVSWP